MDAYSFVPVFEDKAYFAQLNSPQTKSDNLNTVHFTDIPIDHPIIPFILQCEEMFGVSITACQILDSAASSDPNTDATNHHYHGCILELLLPNMNVCQQMVNQGIVLNEIRRFPRFPNCEREPPLQIRVSNIPLMFSLNKLRNELDQVLLNHGTIVAIELKMLHSEKRYFFTGVVQITLVPKDLWTLPRDSGLNSVEWNRVLRVNY